MTIYSRIYHVASTKTFIVPWLFAVSIVGLSLFQQTALIKYDPASSSGSSGSGEPNLCQVTGRDISCRVTHNYQMHSQRYQQHSNDISISRTSANLVVNVDFIGFTATCNVFTIHRQTHEVFLVRVAFECTQL